MRLVPLVLLSLSAGVSAADLNVPGDAATITGAIALASHGDTIHVAPGTWVESVDFAGKAITVRSTGGWSVTRLRSPGGSDVTASLGSAAGTAVLEGFRVTGSGSVRVELVPGAATVRRCVITGAASVGVDATGAGKLVEDCRITGHAFGGVRSLGIPGAGVVVRRCLIDGNGTPNLPVGGGLYGRSIAAEDCVVRDNRAVDGAGAADLYALTGTVFTDNVASGRGGAYFEVGQDEFLGIAIDGGTFVRNHAQDTGGLYFDPGSFSIHPGHSVVSCVIAGNTDSVGNVGLYSDPVAPGPGGTNVVSCTVLDNGVIATGSLVVLDSIVRGPSASLTSGTGTSVGWSNVEGGFVGSTLPGSVNFDADPLFVDASHDLYGLLPASPCVDAGNPAIMDPDGSTLDVGARVLAPFVDGRRSLFGEWGLPSLTGAGTLEPDTRFTLTLERARPGAVAAFVLGAAPLFAPFKGGIFVPDPAVVVGGLPVDAGGGHVVPITFPAGVPSGVTLWVQEWIADSAGPFGYAATNGLVLVAP